jgi:hypothetical protein
MKKYLILFISALVLASCSNEVDTTPVKSSEKAVLKLSLSATPNLDSRSGIALDDDGIIYDCTILTFDLDGNISGKGYEAISGGVATFDMQVGLSTNRGESCDVYAIANTNNPNLFDNIQNFDQFHDMFLSFDTAQDLVDGNLKIGNTSITTNGQLMTSEKIRVNVTDGIVPFRIKLYSQSAKIKFTINAEMGDAINGFRVKGYQMFNVPLSGYLDNRYKNINPASAFEAPGGTYGNYPRVNLTDNPTVVNFTYYMNESHQGEVLDNPATSVKERTAAHAPAHATYLEVYVANMEGRTGTYRYYLGNLVTDITASRYNYYNILRGYDYYVTINLNDIDDKDPRFKWD